MEWIAGASLLGLFALFRLPMTVFRGEYDRPRYVHWSFVSEFRRTRHSHPIRPHSVVTQGSYTSPYLLHWLASFLPERRDRIVNTYFGAVSDLALVVAATVAAAFVELEPVAVVVVAAVVLTSPQLVRDDREHTRGFHPRRPAFVIASLSLILLAAGVPGDVYLFGLATILAGLTVLTDRLATRALLGTLVLVSVTDPSAGWVVVGAVVVAAALSAGRVLGLLLADVKLAFDSFLREYSYIDRRPAAVRDALSDLVRNPFVVVAGSTVVLEQWGTLPSPTTTVPSVYAVWLGAGLLGFVFSSVPRLGFLGQRDGYLEFATIPAAVIVAQWFAAFGSTFRAVVVVLLAAGAALQYARWRSDGDPDTGSDTEPPDGFDEVVATLSDRCEGVVALHPATRASELAWKTGHKTLDCTLNEESSTDQIRLLFPERFRQFTEDVRMIRYYYRPDWAVVDKSVVDEESAWRPGFAAPEYENERYVVYAFPDLVPETY